jgi:hypothetical protein
VQQVLILRRELEEMQAPLDLGDASNRLREVDHG